jgi:hypothetical protein
VPYKKQSPLRGTTASRKKISVRKILTGQTLIKRIEIKAKEESVKPQIADFKKSEKNGKSAEKIEDPLKPKSHLYWGTYQSRLKMRKEQLKKRTKSRHSSFSNLTENSIKSAGKIFESARVIIFVKKFRIQK